jgi:hypothetical protein
MADSKNPDKREQRTAPAGHVRHDKSGRAIWECAVHTGRHALVSLSRLLKRLDNPGLTLEEDKKKAPPTFGGTRESDPMAGKARGFNPYDTRSPPPRHTPATSAKVTRPTARSPVNQQIAPAKKPGLLSRLFGGKR